LGFKATLAASVDCRSAFRSGALPLPARVFRLVALGLG